VSKISSSKKESKAAFSILETDGVKQQNRFFSAAIAHFISKKRRFVDQRLKESKQPARHGCTQVAYRAISAGVLQHRSFLSLDFYNSKT